MKKRTHFFSRGGLFLLTLLLLFACLDVALSQMHIVETSPLFVKNDFEKTILGHGGATEYDQVLYGNSVIISAFREEESQSNYVNFGLDYGTMTDLRDMLLGGYVTVKEDLVLALNYFTFLDTMDTNPTYPWHKKPWEPYLYFQRDRLHTFLTTGLENLLASKPFVETLYESTDKYVYYGMMSEEELQERIDTHRTLYWGLGLTSYQENFSALEDVISYCSENGIRLRAIWMPWNPVIAMPENPRRVCETADALLKEAGIEVLDMTDALPQDCFFDLGHLNYEHGAYIFTEELTAWLLS